MVGCNHLTYGMHRINGVFSTLFVKKIKKHLLMACIIVTRGLQMCPRPTN